MATLELNMLTFVLSFISFCLQGSLATRHKANGLQMLLLWRHGLFIFKAGTHLFGASFDTVLVGVFSRRLASGSERDGSHSLLKWWQGNADSLIQCSFFCLTPKQASGWLHQCHNQSSWQSADTMWHNRELPCCAQFLLICYFRMSKITESNVECQHIGK